MSGISSHQNKYIAADDDDEDIDEASLPAYGANDRPILEFDADAGVPVKGKGRMDDQLSGKIGTPVAGSSGGPSTSAASGGPRTAQRQRIGGVQVETRSERRRSAAYAYSN